MPKKVGYVKAKMSNKSNEEIANEGAGSVSAKKPRKLMTPSNKPKQQ